MRRWRFRSTMRPGEATTPNRFRSSRSKQFWNRQWAAFGGFSRPGCAIMIRDVLRMGDPRLLQVSEPVSEFGAPELFALLQDMQDTMIAQNGAGIAAPQIGVVKRVVI